MFIVFRISYSFVDKVKITTRMLCHPLLEDQFRPIISENYYEAKIFWFELDQRQTNRLIALFSSSPILAAVSSSERASRSSKALQTINVGEDSTNHEVFSSNINVACPDSKKKWSSLFKVSSADAREDGEDFKKPTSELNLSNSKLYNYEWEEPSCTSHSSEEERKSCEAPTDDSRRHREIEESTFFKSRNEIYFSSCSDVKVEGEEYESTASEVNIPHSNLEDVAENMEGDALFKSDEEQLLEDNHEEDIQTMTEKSSLGANEDVDLNSDCRLVAQVLGHLFLPLLCFGPPLYVPVCFFFLIIFFLL